jgi:hypothetical protein
MAVESKAEESKPRPAEASPLLVPIIVLLLSMGACATIPPEGPPMPVAQCNAAAVSWVLGREPTADVVERARVESGSATVRVIHPGTAVTADFRADRLNLNVNARNAIDALKCG